MIERLMDNPMPTPCGLCREKGLKKPLHGFCRDANAGVDDGDQNSISIFHFRTDQELPWTIVHVTDGFHGVDNQIQEDLLHLDTVTQYRW